MTKKQSKQSRGFFGVACYSPKRNVNVGGLWRSAHNFGAAFLATIGRRYPTDPEDVTKAARHVPLLHFATIDDFFDMLPYDTQTVAVEITEEARSLLTFTHPQRAVYLLGPEDGSLPQPILERVQHTVVIPTTYCLNLAMAGTCVLYDRLSKRG